MMYSGAFAFDAWKNVVRIATIPNRVALWSTACDAIS
jgi:hypothetical protein